MNHQGGTRTQRVNDFTPTASNTLSPEQGTQYHAKPFSYFSLIYDPSAGSPTETLLRLLLPLSAPVRVSSCRAPSLATSVRQSKHLTGTLNR